jgi:hypothetical protein
MFHDLPDDAHSQQVLPGEGWLLNPHERTFVQIKPDPSTEHPAQVLVSTFRWAPVLGDPIRQQRLLPEAANDMWITLQAHGWSPCSSPVR